MVSCKPILSARGTRLRKSLHSKSGFSKKYDLSAPELFWRRRSRAGKDIIAGGNDVPASVGYTITFLKFATFYCAALRMDFVHSPNFYFGDEQISFYAKKSTMRLHRAFLAEKEGLTPLP
ncbi:hypothetical protein, partial [uncultured Negativibacillus sp.]|uniref:hypothetical protein n=1 Tax=uncultured Negativibacillus sp. TaxID=1980696 RepID=UPI0025E18B03